MGPLAKKRKLGGEKGVAKSTPKLGGENRGAGSTSKPKPKREVDLVEPDAGQEPPPQVEEEAQLPLPEPRAPVVTESAVLSDGRVAKQPKVIIILERACLETGKVGKDHVLLNCDDHHGFLRKHKRDPADSRPDILHQCMLILLDSPLNKAGLLKLYVRTEKGVLIDVSPQIRIPRTFKRFSGLMCQLLFKLSIRASNGAHKLLSVIKNPVTDHLPPNCHITLLSVTGRLVHLPEFIPSLPQTGSPAVFVVGAMAHGKVEADYAHDSIAVSEYPLSGAAALGRLTNAWENYLGIL